MATSHYSVANVVGVETIQNLFYPSCQLLHHKKCSQLLVNLFVTHIFDSKELYIKDKLCLLLMITRLKIKAGGGNVVDLS